MYMYTSLNIWHMSLSRWFFDGVADCQDAYKTGILTDGGLDTKIVKYNKLFIYIKLKSLYELHIVFDCHSFHNC